MDAKHLERHIAREGVPGPMPDGPALAHFSALELAQAIESEVNRAQGVGHTKLRLDFTFDDAIALAAFLRRAVILGA